MRPGARIAGRYTVEALAGAGGMGQVFRAHDDAGRKIAVKLLFRPSEEARFTREVRVLSALTHPGIVKYLDHGTTPEGQPFLAMEWLEGESLQDRLRRGRLSPASTVDLGIVVAGALGAAHALGVVHRDLKPANLFLVDRRASKARVLDFGIARVRDGEAALTHTGDMIGTVGFMAPEQARGDREVTARADVFALGCVLYACVTGQRPFTGDDQLTVLLKITLDDPPRPSELCAGLSDELDDLILRMLAKRPEDRPADGAAVAAELMALRSDMSIEESLDPSSRAPRSRIGDDEQRLVSLILASEPIAMTGPPSAEPGMLDVKSLRAIAGRHKARIDFLLDGSVLVTLARSGAATDSARIAARCALAMRPLLPKMAMAVVSGRGVLSSRAPMGELIERAVALVREEELASSHPRESLPPFDPGRPSNPFDPGRPSNPFDPGRPSSPGPDSSPSGIRIDAATAGLLDPSFAVVPRGEAQVLVGVRDVVDASRKLLGKPTACVGRERELATLDALFLETVSEPVARAVLVIGGPGMGKSRLRHELLRRIALGDENVEVWIARGDPMRQGSSFGLLSQAISKACGIGAGEPAPVRIAKIRDRVARHVASSEARRVAEMLAEIVGAPVPDREATRELRAARLDPLSMAEPMRRAWETFLLAEVSAHPVVLVLEDLHWGDAPTVSFVEAALRVASERPLFVMALGRPEVHGVFPGVFRQHDVQELRLPKLTRRAAEKLVRQVLGDSADPAIVASIVERADGNPFYLEELIRSSVERGTTAAPETVLSMVQARVESLEPEARKILRAASVFGRTFWKGGVEALCPSLPVAAWLSELVDREWIAPDPEQRFPGEPTFKFRHDLVRDVAYGMFTDRDRAIAHRLAAEWLDGSGEPDAALLGEHFERGGELLRAAGWYRIAAERALHGDDLDSAVDLAQRGIACGAEGELRSQLATIAIEAHGWRNDWTEGAAHADELLASEPEGTRPWCMAASVKVWSAPLRGQLEGYVETIQRLQAVAPAPDATGDLVQALCAVVMSLTVVSAHDAAAAFLARVEELGAPIERVDHAAAGWMNVVRGYRARQLHGAIHESLSFMQAAMVRFGEEGNPHHVHWARTQAGIDAWLLGAHAQAVAHFREAIGTGTGELDVLGSLSRLFLASTLCDAASTPDVTELAEQGGGAERHAHFEEAKSLLATVIAAESDRHNLFFEGMARSALAEIHAQTGDLESGEAEARLAIERLEAMPFDAAVAKSRLSGIRLRRGDAKEAHRLARDAAVFFEACPGYGAAWGDLALAESQLALGDGPAARATLKQAVSRLSARSAAIPDPALRASFTLVEPRHARLLALALRELGREDA